MTLSESPNNASMSFKTCRQLIHEDFRKVLTQQPHGKISEYLYILRYLITNNSFKFCFWFRLGSWSKGKKRVSYPDIGRHIYKLINVLLL